MGSIGTARKPGLTHTEFFQNEWGGKNLEILDQYTDGRIIYFACRYQGTYTIPIIVETWRVHGRDGMNFIYKEVEESMGPHAGHQRCSDRLLDQLSPLEDIYEVGSDSYERARSWREACRTENARIADLPKPETGDMIEFEKRVTDHSLGGPQRLIFVQRNTFRNPDLDDMPVRINNNWRRMFKWKIVQP